MKKKVKVYGYAKEKFKIWFYVTFKPPVLEKITKKPKAKMELVCTNCRKTIEKGKSYIRAERNNYCSHECRRLDNENAIIYWEANRAVHRLNREHKYYASEKITFVKFRGVVFKI